ncbi:MAG: hypothetical protein AABZ56_09030 [Bacteroidota bacterium]|jgi:hypothetical protein
MQHTTLRIIILIIVGVLVGLYLPWYAMGVQAGIIAFLLRFPTKSAFITGFVAGFLLWGLAAFWMNTATPSGLPARMASVLPLHGEVGMLYLVTGAIGGIVLGFWTWAGARLR